MNVFALPHFAEPLRLVLAASLSQSGFRTVMSPSCTDETGYQSLQRSPRGWASGTSSGWTLPSYATLIA